MMYVVMVMMRRASYRRKGNLVGGMRIIKQYYIERNGNSGNSTPKPALALG